MWVVYAFLAALTAALVAIFAKLGLKAMDTTIATTAAPGGVWTTVISAAILI